MLDEIENEIFEALGNRKIKEMSDDELSMRLNGLILKTSVLTGTITPKETFVAIFVANLQEMLRKGYSGLTFSEVTICFTMGAQGLFGDYHGMNLSTFRNWLIAYKNCSERQAALARLHKKDDKDTSCSYKRYLRGMDEMTYARGVYRAYKWGWDIEQYNTCIVYMILEKHGIIHDTIKEKEEAYRRFWRVSILGVPLTGEARRGLAGAQAMGYLLKKNFDRMIEEQKRKELEQQQQATQVNMDLSQASVENSNEGLRA